MILPDFKVVTIGDSGAGKTSVIQKFHSGAFFNEMLPTIGSFNLISTISVDDQEVTLNLWDTAGQEKFNSLLPMYMRNANAILFVFDISLSNPIPRLTSLYEDLKDDFPIGASFFLVGNKSDLVEQAFDIEPFTRFARVHNMVFIKTSAKTGENIPLLFALVAKKCLENAKLQTKQISPNEIRKVPKTDDSCC